ncbi:ATP-grasp domain-containing protein [Marinifilum fragile]|uniref:ATP-grasp domain-containing protein n=1 Tax=Marinifilum fragile TaxID=570161 RepID=UPI002AAC0971|nr:ATP-grasp domain-containing protein [Marinifilum fragile]
MDKQAILIFGVGPLQKSIIDRCKRKGIYTIGIDPDKNAICKNLVDVFEVVEGKDYMKTIEVAKKYKVTGIITSATDKPLVMMARVAKTLNLSFFSVETAQIATDKYLMKQKFREAGIPCAKGVLLNKKIDLDDLDCTYPVIVKPRDNSGSRGVVFCDNLKSLHSAVEETFQYTTKENVLVEEFINGKEYSIESIHYNGESNIIQITEKRTTEFPYNVELGHIQPASISAEQKDEIKQLIIKIGNLLGFDNCASHTELKINSNGIKIIETSPRLGGDFISSTLVPLSTGINMEEILIDISINNPLATKYFQASQRKNSGIIYFQLPEGVITDISNLNEISHVEGVHSWSFDLTVGEKVNKISSSLNRYGYAIFQSTQKKSVDLIVDEINRIVHKNIKIQVS